MTQGQYSEKTYIKAGMCDSSARLGMADTFVMFMDIASHHADLIGCGMDALMEKGYFWLTVRTSVEFYTRPAMGREITLTTWPEKPSKYLCNRDYRIEDETGVLVEGKTEWAVSDIRAGKAAPVSVLYPEDLVICEEKLDHIAFPKFRDDAADFEPLGDYRVVSTDTDLGGHMNNAAYVRAAAGLLSTEEWKSLAVLGIDTMFSSQAREGDVLSFGIKKTDGMITLRALSGDGRTVFGMKIRTGVRGNA